MKSRFAAPVSAPAWGASSVEGSAAGSPGDPGLGLRARRSVAYDLLGGGVLLLAWMLLWSWFAVAMVQPARPRGPAAAAAVLGFSKAPGRHMVPPDTSRIFRTEATPQRAPQAAHTS